MKEIDDFLSKKSFPKLVFSKVWGSRSHQLELPESDWDFSGVYVLPTKSILSFRPFEKTLDGKSPDYSFHEVGKFCDLLLKGNPGILEMLFTDKMCNTTPEWDWIKQIRRKFLTRQSISAYRGFAVAQMNSLKHNGKYDTKAAYHLIRLLQDALRISRGGEPVVWKEGHQRDFLMSIRRNEIMFKDLEKTYNNLFAEIKAQEPFSDLPEKGDEDALEEWLITVRMRNI